MRCRLVVQVTDRSALLRLFFKKKLNKTLVIVNNFLKVNKKEKERRFVSASRSSCSVEFCFTLGQLQLT